MSKKATIGLEIHAELKTDKKMFCYCKNNPHESEPNTNICPVCMAHPGALPVPNKEAIKSMIKIGLALNGEISMDFTEFDRKSYFYPDMPKAYQISQFKYPIVSHGSLLGVDITRVHLEEDTARSIHGADHGDTMIDFNRSGVPLMELVTEPVIKDADQARAFAKELQRVLRILGVSDANMEKGEMRVEANVSIQNPDGSFGTKVEVKNLNSFKAVHQAIEYEIKRQSSLIDSGQKVVQETRGWDDSKAVTFSQRKKENSADYRYFPDPDLPKLILQELTEFDLDTIRQSLPELPEDIRIRLSQTGIDDKTIDFYLDNPSYLRLLDNAVDELGSAHTKLISNYISSDISGAMAGEELASKFFSGFISIFKLVSADKISSRTAKDLISDVLKDSNLNIEEYVDKMSLWQVNDTVKLREVLEEVISDNPSAVGDYKSGKEKALGAIIGITMKKLKEQSISANPRLLTDLAKELLR